jgi:hypothetical protein
MLFWSARELLQGISTKRKLVATILMAALQGNEHSLIVVLELYNTQAGSVH